MALDVHLVLDKLLRGGVEIRFCPTLRGITVEVFKFWNGVKHIRCVNVSFEDFLNPRVWLDSVMEHGYELMNVYIWKG